MPSTSDYIIAGLISFAISLLVGDKLILLLKKMQGNKGQPIRDDGPKSHYLKKGTPTMGGLLIFISYFATQQMCFAKIQSNFYLWILHITLFLYGVIGFLDDQKKLNKQNSKGIKSKIKFFLQTISAVFLTYYLVKHCEGPLSIYVPFYKNIIVSELFYFCFAVFIIVGSSNGVNLTDGLDGLVTLPLSLVLLSFIFIATDGIYYNSAVIDQMNHDKMTAILCFASTMLGSLMGFLWYNLYPARIFMGDIGSLPLGAVLGVISIILKIEFIFAILGGLFVIESLSVIIQVTSFKIRKKRVFLMSPIHHHFEKIGWHENRVVGRFWLFSLFCMVLGLLVFYLNR